MSDYGADVDPDIGDGWELAHADNFISTEKVNMMQWTYADRKVIKLANKIGHSNILFLIDTS